MSKDLAFLVDPGTKAAGPYALSSAKLLDAHLTMVPADIEPALAAYASPQLRYDAILARREGQREAIGKRVAHLQSDGLAQGLSISMLSIDDCAEDSLSALTRTSRVFDLIIVEHAD